MDIFESIKGYVNSDENLIRSSKELDIAIEHIVQLICDSYTLYSNNSFASSLFLSITVCEEVAKAHLGSFTDGEKPKGKPKNIFHDHKTKHALAAMPTVAMGKRLQEAIGEDEMDRIMSMAGSFEMLKLRESSLYFQREKDVLITPKTKIDKDLARSFLLFSIEVFDDALVGMTAYSMEIDKKTDEIFKHLTNEINKT